MRVILDADGVFFCERPYWRVALATALTLLGVEDVAPDTFRALDVEMFDVRAMHRIAKAVGVNSNWHLCGMMVCSLREPDRRSGVIASLASGDVGDVRAVVDGWSNALREYVSHLADRQDESGAPLGYLEAEPEFAPVIPQFQRVFHGEDPRFDVEPRYEALGEPRTIREAFDRLQGLGAVVSICTGRNRRETLEPLRAFELVDPSLETRLITHDVVEEAEQASGTSPLSKPHWFPTAAAIAGAEAALDVLRGAKTVAQVCAEPAVFVGDSLADFGSAKNCRAQGADVRFVLVDSGALSRDVAEQVRGSELTVGAVDTFPELPELLERAAL